MDDEDDVYLNDMIRKRKFLKIFMENFNLLYKRYNRFCYYQRKGLYEEAEPYLDIIIVQLRSMCAENSHKNYTIQNLFNLFEQNDLSDNINRMLDEKFINFSEDDDRYNFSIKKAIKSCADRIICHYDNFDDEVLLRSTILLVLCKLSNRNFEKSIHYILKVIVTNLESFFGCNIEEEIQNFSKRDL